MDGWLAVPGPRRVPQKSPGVESLRDLVANAQLRSRALAVGLTHRPLAETVSDTLAWDTARGGPAVADEGLTAAEEQRPLNELT